MPGESNAPNQLQPFDPSKNVLDLVLAAVRRLDDLGASVVKRQDDLREALDKRTTELSALRSTQEDRLFAVRNEYERRIEALRTSQEERMEAVKTDFGKQIANILERQAEKSASLLSTQVAATTDRLAVVEKNQYVSGGQTAVRDPAISDALKLLGDSIATTNRNIDALSKVTSATRDTGAGSDQGRAQLADMTGRTLIILIGIGAIIMPVVMHFVK